MDIITADFETAYCSKSGYTLSKMQTDAYVLDPRFQVIGVSIKVNDHPAVWYSHPDPDNVSTWLDQFDWHNSAVCCHNTLFDGFIFTQKFGIAPKLWMDTLAMGRELYPWLKSHSLASLAAALLPGWAKGDAVIRADGKWLADFTPYELQAYGDYCINDTDLCYLLLNLMIDRMPKTDLRLIDMTVRMFTEPKFVGDISMLDKAVVEEHNRKESLLALANIDRTIVMSNDKFAQALDDAGVNPPTKLNSKGSTAWAFAKTDEEFTLLQEHDDPVVQALVAARLGVKTTIAETRAQTMADTARRGPLPVYLNYWGAKQTGRYSGGNKINWQNLPARGPSAGIRKAIRAPAGCKVVVGDSSNIELRVAMMGAGQTDVLEQIRAGIDVYCSFASFIFGRDITKADKKERDLGKAGMLSLQFGTGAEKFKNMARIKAGQKLTDMESQAIVYKYRDKHDRIRAIWQYCEQVILPDMANKGGLQGVDTQGWCLTFDNGFSLPGHPGVVYHNLRHDAQSNNWVYDMGRYTVKTYGANVFQNMVQHVARQIVMWQTERVNRRYPVALSVHDEIVCVVPDDEVEACKAYMLECLSTAPSWCKGIPLAGEVGVGQSYGEAK